MSPNTDPATARQLVDEAARDLATRRNMSDFELGQLLVMAQDVEVEKSFGFTFHEWAQRRFGLPRRAVEDRLRVARSLETLPRLREKSERGEISYSVLRELVRVAEAETEEDWIDAASGKTGHEVQKLVNGCERGDAPTDAKKPEAEQHRVTMSLSPQAMALLNEARRVKTEELGRRVEDDELVAEALAALLDSGTSRDPGRSAFQMHMYVCERCRDGELPGGVVATQEDVEMARCDASVVPSPERGGRASQTIPPRIRRQVIARQKGVCAVPGCSNRVLHVHHVDPRSEGGQHVVENLAGVCFTHHRPSHRGALIIRPDGKGWFTFEHADGTLYGSERTEGVKTEVMMAAFETLRTMGFKETEARKLLDSVRTAVRFDDGVPEVLRRALRAVPSPPGVETLGVRESFEEYRAGAAQPSAVYRRAHHEAECGNPSPTPVGHRRFRSAKAALLSRYDFPHRGASLDGRPRGPSHLATAVRCATWRRRRQECGQRSARARTRDFSVEEEV